MHLITSNSYLRSHHRGLSNSLMRMFVCVWSIEYSWEEEQKSKQRERKARKKEAKAALVQELRRNGQGSQKARGQAKEQTNEDGGKEDATAGQNDADVVTINNRKNRRATKQNDTDTEMAALPPKKRKKRD
jgi:hypothetical protein